MMAKGILRTIRGNAGLTQEEAAEKLFVSVSTIQRWERADKCSPNDLQNMLNLYGIDPESGREIIIELFGGGLCQSDTPALKTILLMRIAEAVEDLRREVSLLQGG